MKILLDPVYTNLPSKCASTIKMKKVVEHFLSTYKDVFFYWLHPEWADAEEMKFFTQHKAVRLIPYPYDKDRMREFNRVAQRFEDLISFQGQLWDFDLIITNRTSMVPYMKSIMFRPSTRALWSKKVFLIEDMPIMGFKATVPISNERAQDILTIGGYLTADRTAVSAFWEKDIILREMRKYCSPASVAYVEETMIESSPLLFHTMQLKEKKFIQPMLEKKRPFCIGWVGRMTQTTGSEKVFGMMGKQWIFRAKEKIRTVAFTNSMTDGKVHVPEWMEVLRLPREEFWKTIREEVDVYVNLATEEDYPMSLMEPLVLGCPVILVRSYWSVPSVGETYPFYVKNEAEAYAMAKLFIEDYAGQYRKFAEWYQSHLIPMMKERNKVYVPYLVQEMVEEMRLEQAANLQLIASLAENQIVDVLDGYAKKNGKELVLFDALQGLSDKFRFLHEKTKRRFVDCRHLVFGTEWNLFRLGLIARGYKDASTKVGHMRRA